MAHEIFGKDWMFVNEAADEFGYHPEHIRLLIRTGRVDGKKAAGRIWVVSRSSLQSYVDQLGDRNKPGPKTER